MIGVQVEVSCPFDGHPVQPLEVGDPEGTMSTITVRCTACRSEFLVAAAMTATTVRFSFTELERFIIRCLGVPAHAGDLCGCNTAPGKHAGDACASVATIARMCGVKDDTVQSWKRRGMNDRKADAVATALGVHARDIWPDAWDALCAGDLDAEVDA